MEEPSKILVVDDEAANLHALEAMLLPLGYQVTLAGDGEEALEKVREVAPNVILLDTLMPKIDGFEVVRRLKEDEATKIIPVVMITALSDVEDRLKALEAGADDFLTKPVDVAELRARVNSLLKVNAYNEHLRHYQQDMEAEVAKRTEALTQSFEKIKIASLDTVYRLSRAAEYKDEDTGAHVERMSHYSSAIARAMGCDDDFVESVPWASPMHDIGKIGIPDRVLQKPGKLDDDEWVIMRQHAAIGAEILKDASADFIKLAESIAISHHEKWNGSGYPNGVQGADIPLGGRIVALADVFDALTSERPYKAPFPLEKALAIIKEGRESHFDPELVDAFSSIEDEIKKELGFWKFMQAEPASEEDGMPDLSDLFGSGSETEDLFSNFK
ncbi:HD domain-containing phosphohydrolase [Chloroflexota bacterium]